MFDQTWYWDPRLPFFAELGRREAVWSNYHCKIDLNDTPERFQALLGVKSGLQDRKINVLRYLNIVWWCGVEWSGVRCAVRPRATRGSGGHSHQWPLISSGSLWG